MISDYELAQSALDAYIKLSGTSGSDVQYFIKETDTDVTISVRGSEVKIVDWVTNLRMAPWYDDHCGWCHAGFVKSARDLALDIAELKYKFNGKKIYFTGHSQGGAVAVLAAQICVERWGMDVEKVVVFGCPKPFVFGRPDYKFNVVSYVMPWDIVTKVPFGFFGVANKNIKLKGERGHKMSGYAEILKTRSVSD